jgi:hypothetical protein
MAPAAMPDKRIATPQAAAQRRDPVARNEAGVDFHCNTME